MVCVLHKLHYIRTPAYGKLGWIQGESIGGVYAGVLSELTSRFRVPQAHPCRRYVLVDEAGDGGAESFLLVRANPNQVPGEQSEAIVSIQSRLIVGS